MADDTKDSHLSELARGAALALANAEDLFREGTALLACKAFSRALFLYQISLEECGKAEMLGWRATGCLMGMSVNLNKSISRLANHRAKNFANAYMLPLDEAERKARDQDNWRGAHSAFKKRQAAFHRQSNERKNASLYVDFVNGVFIAPRERITEEMVHEIAARSFEFIELMRPKVEMLARWAQEPDATRQLMNSFRDRMEKLRDEYPDAPQKALDVLLDEMLAQAKEAQQHSGVQPSEPPPSVLRAP